MYIGPEFQLGQVYDGGGDGVTTEPVLLYRPVYVCIPNAMHTTTPSSKARRLVSDSKSSGTRSGTSGSFLNKLHSSGALLNHPGKARNHSGCSSNASNSPSGIMGAEVITASTGKDRTASSSSACEKKRNYGETALFSENDPIRNKHSNKEIVDLSDVKLDSKAGRGSKTTKDSQNRNSL